MLSSDLAFRLIVLIWQEDSPGFFARVSCLHDQLLQTKLGSNMQLSVEGHVLL